MPQRASNTVEQRAKRRQNQIVGCLAVRSLAAAARAKLLSRDVLRDRILPEMARRAIS